MNIEAWNEENGTITALLTFLIWSFVVRHSCFAIFSAQ
jgi:hypothetical protein